MAADDDDQPYAAMNMDADYEDGQFINGEFYAKGARKRKAQTAEQALYGIWAEDDEDDGGRRSGLGGGSAALSKQVAFVSRGIVNNVDTVNPTSAPSGANSSKATPSASSTAGVGASSAASTSKAEAPAKLEFKSFGKRNRGAAPEKKPAAPTAPAVPLPVDKDFAKFEQHTKGIGLKLLMKMGFQGRLGKTEQGIAIPLQPKAVAPVIGKNLFVSHHAARTRDEEEKLKREAEEKGKQSAASAASSSTGERSANWARGPKRVKREYKTVEDLTKTDADMLAPSGPQPMVIIDATGPQVKVTTLDKISSKVAEETPTGGSRAGRLPELQHNVRLMVDLVEGDIHKLDREKKHVEDSIFSLEKEHDQLQSALLRDREVIQRSEDLLGAIDAIRAKLSSLDLSSSRASAATGAQGDVSEQVDTLATLVGSLQQRFPEEFRVYGLSSLVSACTFPALKAYLAKWSPLFPMSSNGVRGTLEVLPHVTKWRTLLGEGPDGAKVWRKFLRQLIVPRVMSAVSGWNPRDPQPLLVLMRSLKSILHEDIYEDLMLRTLAPRLLQEVQQRWNPRQDSTPVDRWLQPWHGVLPSEALEPLYREVRSKLADVLQAWHASDQSAYIVVAPWHRVWRDEDFESFLVRSILPKLASALQNEFTVAPHQQNIAPFQWVMQWHALLNARLLNKLLDSYFFPKWFTALYTWLSQDASFDEVSAWYTGWKEQFPPALRDSPSIKLHFTRALDLMNAALESQPLLPLMQRIMQSLDSQPARAGAPSLSVGVKQAVAASAAAALRSKKPDSASSSVAPEDEELNFRDVVEKYAEYHNITFMPNVKRGKFDGKQIYSFGRVNLYLNNGVVYTSDKDDDSQIPSLWRPIPLDELLTRATEKEAQKDAQQKSKPIRL